MMILLRVFRLIISFCELFFQVMYTPKSGGELCPAIVQPFGGGSEKDPTQQHYYKVTYTPETDGPCRIEVTYDDVHVPGSPYVVKIRKASEPNLVRVLGAGIKGPVLASLPATFTVDAREAGMGDLTLGITVREFICTLFY